MSQTTAEIEDVDATASEMNESLKPGVPVIFNFTGVVNINVDFDHYLFIAELEEYFAVGALEQKRNRARLAQAILDSEQIDFTQRLQLILSHVAEQPSQENLIAAIELITSIGPRAARFAQRVIRMGINLEDNSLFVLSAAAARQGSDVQSALLQSGNIIVREGVVEALARDGGLSAVALLELVAKFDSCDTLRERARELIED